MMPLAIRFRVAEQLGVSVESLSRRVQLFVQHRIPGLIPKRRPHILVANAERGRYTMTDSRSLEEMTGSQVRARQRQRVKYTRGQQC
jgi:hypothetical protein